MSLSLLRECGNCLGNVEESKHQLLLMVLCTPSLLGVSLAGPKHHLYSRVMDEVVCKSQDHSAWSALWYSFLAFISLLLHSSISL